VEHETNQLVGVRVDVSRCPILLRLQRRAAAVAGRESGGLLRGEGLALVLPASAGLGVLGREDARGGLGGKLAADEAVPPGGRGGANAVVGGRRGRRR
jgi:hypothetical protein